MVGMPFPEEKKRFLNTDFSTVWWSKTHFVTSSDVLLIMGCPLLLNWAHVCFSWPLWSCSTCYAERKLIAVLVGHCTLTHIWLAVQLHSKPHCQTAQDECMPTTHSYLIIRNKCTFAYVIKLLSTLDMSAHLPVWLEHRCMTAPSHI